VCILLLGASATSTSLTWSAPLSRAIDEWTQRIYFIVRGAPHPHLWGFKYPFIPTRWCPPVMFVGLYSPFTTSIQYMYIYTYILIIYTVYYILHKPNRQFPFGNQTWLAGKSHISLHDFPSNLRG
jgi:transglutaminase-like putative cysteine protease